MQYQMMELEIARFRERKTEEKDAELAARCGEYDRKHRNKDLER